MQILKLNDFAFDINDKQIIIYRHKAKHQYMLYRINDNANK